MHFTASTSVTVHTFEILYLISGKIFSHCPGMLKIRCYMAILRCCWSHSKQSHICMELILPLNQLHIILPIYPISYREKNIPILLKDYLWCFTSSTYAGAAALSKSTLTTVTGVALPDCYLGVWHDAREISKCICFNNGSLYDMLIYQMTGYYAASERFKWHMLNRIRHMRAYFYVRVNIGILHSYVFRHVRT